MEPQRVGLRDVDHGPTGPHFRLLAPLHYLRIWHPEKARYDFFLPAVVTIALWVGYYLVEPKPPLFGGDGLLKYARDLLVMAVPFLVGALASVAMGAPGGPGGQALDRRPPGADLLLDGQVLSLRQFVCYLLGYLCLLGLATLGFAVICEMMKPAVMSWTAHAPNTRMVSKGFFTLILFGLLSALSVTVLWALYFLTEIVNRRD